MLVPALAASPVGGGIRMSGRGCTIGPMLLRLPRTWLHLRALLRLKALAYQHGTVSVSTDGDDLVGRIERARITRGRVSIRTTVVAARATVVPRDLHWRVAATDGRTVYADAHNGRWELSLRSGDSISLAVDITELIDSERNPVQLIGAS